MKQEQGGDAAATGKPCPEKGARVWVVVYGEGPMRVLAQTFVGVNRYDRWVLRDPRALHPGDEASGATATGGAPRRATRYPRGTEWTGRRGFPDMHWSPDAVYLTEAESWAAIVASLQEDLDEAKRRMVEAGGVAP